MCSKFEEIKLPYDIDGQRVYDCWARSQPRRSQRFLHHQLLPMWSWGSKLQTETTDELFDVQTVMVDQGRIRKLMWSSLAWFPRGLVENGVRFGKGGRGRTAQLDFSLLDHAGQWTIHVTTWDSWDHHPICAVVHEAKIEFQEAVMNKRGRKNLGNNTKGQEKKLQEK